MPADTSIMSVVGGRSGSKPSPPGIDPLHPPVIYSAPECSGTRLIDATDRANRADLEYLRQYRAGTETSGIWGRVVEDERFGIFEPPGLPGVAVMLSGDGIGKMERSDTDGYYRFRVVPGKYVVKPVLRPYEPSQEIGAVEVPQVGCAAINFDMIAPGVIKGRLLDHFGKSASGVRVEVLRLGKDGKPIFYAEKKTTSGIDGRYSFEKLPSGHFEIGVNIFEAPDEKTPYARTTWADHAGTSIALAAGGEKEIMPFRLPAPSPAQNIEVHVSWPDGRPASGVNVWGDFEGRAATGGLTDASGVAKFKGLQGITYSIEAKIWVGEAASKEVARSGVTPLTPGPEPSHLDLVLNRRTKGY